MRTSAGTGDRVRVRLRRGLRPVAAEPLMPQEPVRDGHDLQILIQHRPVPLSGWQPHRKRPHLLIPPISCLATRTSTSHEHDTHGETPCHRQERTDKATSCDRSRTPGKGLRRTETSKLDLADCGPEPGGAGVRPVRDAACPLRQGVRGRPPRRRNVASVMGWAVEARRGLCGEHPAPVRLPDHPALWVTERGGRVKPAEINARFVAYREALGLPGDLSPHSCGIPMSPT